MEDQKTVDLFVPGRLCLLGEHSDWAGMQSLLLVAQEGGFFSYVAGVASYY